MPPVEVPIKLSLPSLLSHASLPVVVTVVVLLVASTAVWFVGVLKMLQAARSRSRTRAFEKRVRDVGSADDLLGLAWARGRVGRCARAPRHGVARAAGGRRPAARRCGSRHRRGTPAREDAHAGPGIDRRGRTLHGALRHGLRHHGRVRAHRSRQERLAARRRSGDRRGAHHHRHRPGSGHPRGAVLQRRGQAGV